MELIVDRKPFILYETVEMMFKYVNHLPILDTGDKMRRTYHGCYDDAARMRQLERLQQITEECCAGLNVDDPEIQFFFRRVDTEDIRDSASVAKTMVISFAPFVRYGLEEAEVLKDTWRNICATGYHITGFDVGGFTFGTPPDGGEQASLLEQICALDYPAEFRLDVLRAFQDYDRYMDRLVECIRPYACRLEKLLEQDAWIIESAADYWEQKFQTSTPESFIAKMCGVKDTKTVEQETRRMVIMVMMFSEVYSQNVYLTYRHPEGANFGVGCAVREETTIQQIARDDDRTCVILRFFGDKTKFTLLRRLSQNRNYCQKLAEELGCNTGNLSRSLSSLQLNGFLNMEREHNRVYYTTNTEAVSAFLREVEMILTARNE